MPIKSQVTSCHILPNSHMLVACKDQILTYSLECQHLHTLKKDDLLSGLGDIHELVSLKNTDKCDFIMRASVKDLESIKSHKIEHTYKGKKGDNTLVAALSQG